MVMLKQNSLDKEEARIAAMRARAEARTQRFLNARTRTMGVDKAGLDAQVEEKRRATEARKQADMDQAAYDQQILRMLEENEAQSRAEKMAALHALRDDLLQKASEPKNQCPKIGESYDAEDCGTGAAQYFAGEDKNAFSRRRLQQTQMKQWTSQQKAEKVARNMEEKEDEMRFHQYLMAVDDMRGQMEGEDKRRTAEERLNFRKLNEEQAALTRATNEQDRQLQAKMDSMELTHGKNDPFLNEETDFGTSAVAPHRVRPDHFKGFNKEQVQWVYAKNGELVEAHQQMKQDERDTEKAWGNHVAAVTRVMEQNEQESKAQANYMNQLQNDTLTQQRAEQKAKKAQSNQDKFGAIEGGFYKGFGTSCR
ncbi:hypothetical protein TrLO_g10695 [Triparma laevis f. longispina]|uniref:RIB43A-like with coiled-coils protein 1 n=1 Tax=Triparma laevis f. longispina TaxID=1714387 RepID=A0A9W7FFF0_9STRA|nr:hypothetical protein TrLO_g10695 [Triparma laevis f. longispina]